MDIDKVNFQVFFNHFKQSSFKRFKIDYMIKIIDNEFLFEISGKYNSEYFSIFGIYDKCFRQIKTDKLDILNTQINIIKRNSFYKKLDNSYKFVFFYLKYHIFLNNLIKHKYLIFFNNIINISIYFKF